MYVKNTDHNAPRLSSVCIKHASRDGKREISIATNDGCGDGEGLLDRCDLRCYSFSPVNANVTHLVFGVDGDGESLTEVVPTTENLIKALQWLESKD